MTQPPLDDAPTTQFYIVNQGQHVVCRDCRPNAPEVQSDAIALNAEQLKELQLSDIASHCDLCGQPFFTRTR